MKHGRGGKMEDTERPNSERIRTLEKKKNYKYLGILEVDSHKQSRDERKKEYLRRMRRLLETKLAAEISSKG